jgi:hypothetical protein
VAADKENRNMKGMGYIIPHMIHELWDVCIIKDLKNVKSQNVFLMSMKNIACKIDNCTRNPLVASILHLDSQWEERRRVNYEVHHDRRRWRLTRDRVGSDGWRWRLTREAKDQMEMEMEMSWPKSRGEAHTVVEELGHRNQSNTLHRSDILHRSNCY